MKKFDLDGTKVGTLQDPIISKVQYVAFKRVYSCNLLLLFQDMHDNFPADLIMSMPHYHDICWPPVIT